MKKFLSLLLALTMVLGMAACGSSETAANKGVTLNVVTSYGGDDGNRGNYEAAVKSYEETTGNTVNDASATSNEEWKAKILTDFETGSEPDVLFFFTNADAEPFISANKVAGVIDAVPKALMLNALVKFDKSPLTGSFPSNFTGSPTFEICTSPNEL